MFRVGQKVVCVDASPMRNGCADVMPLRLVHGAVYTIRSIQTEPHIAGYGVRLEELLNPSIIWADGDEREWSYQSERFRPVAEHDSENATELAETE